jgi:DNA-directed RNA polymerase subunit F
MPRKIIEDKQITIAEARKMLEKEKREELGEFQRRTLDYAMKFAKITPAKAERLTEELVKKLQLDREEAVQIVNCMPKTIEELRTILAVKGRIILTSYLEEVLKVVNEFREK